MQKRITPSRAIAREIRAQLARENISLSKLAHMVQMSETTLYRSLRGDRPLMIDELVQISTALGLNLSGLIKQARISS